MTTSSSQTSVPSDRISNIEEEIVDIDVGILNLLDRRMRLASEVWKLQRKTGSDSRFFDLEKEKTRLFKKLESRRKQLKKNIKEKEEQKILLIWGKIIELSNKIQEKEE